MRILEFYSTSVETTSRVFDSPDIGSTEIAFFPEQAFEFEHIQLRVVDEIKKALKGEATQLTVVLSGLVANSAKELAEMYPEHEVIAIADAIEQLDQGFWFENPSLSLYGRLLRTHLSNGQLRLANLWVLTDLERKSDWHEFQVFGVGNLPPEHVLSKLETTKKFIQLVATAAELQLRVTQSSSSLKHAIQTELEKSKALRGEIQTLALETDRLFVSGFASISGLHTSGYGSQATLIHLISDQAQLVWPLGQTKSSAKKFHPINFENYQFNGFSTLRNAGIDLSIVPLGKYTIEIEVRHPQASRSGILAVGGGPENLAGRSVIGNRTFHLAIGPDEQSLVLEVSELALGADLPVLPGKVSFKGGEIVVRSRELLNAKTVALSLFSTQGEFATTAKGVLEGDCATFTPNVQQMPPGRFALAVTLFNEDFQTFELPRTFEVNQSGVLPKVIVWGSQPTLDSFDPEFFAHVNQHFEVAARFKGTSVIDLMRDAQFVSSGPDTTDLEELGAGDTGAHLMQKIETTQPDFLVIDLQNDAAHQSKDTDEEVFLKHFSLAVEGFRQRLSQTAPDTVVVLHSARAVEEYSQEGKRVRFDLSAVKRLNGLWEKVDRVFLESIGALQISIASDANRSDLAHPRGPYPTHYEQSYYRNFHTRLLEELTRKKEGLLRRK